MQRILGLCLALAAAADQPKLRAGHASWARQARRAQHRDFQSVEAFGLALDPLKVLVLLVSTPFEADFYLVPRRLLVRSRMLRSGYGFGYGNESFGGYGGTGYGTTGYGSTGYGNGSTGYGGSFGYGNCAEETCWPLTYTATGEVDWNAPYKARV